MTNGGYGLGALSALEDFVVRGGKSHDFGIFVGIGAGSILPASLANGITVQEMCRGILAEQDHRLPELATRPKTHRRFAMKICR